MSVLIETSLGSLTVDLYTAECPLASKNFLKLCKLKYYNGCLFFNVQRDFVVQCGDPTGTGKGGNSVYGLLYGEQAKYFEDEVREELTHAKRGTLCMAPSGPNQNTSQFVITCREDVDFLDGKHTVFGFVAEGLDVLSQINESYVDKDFRPLYDIRIKHTYVLDDPFEDPKGFEEPEASPVGHRPVEESIMERRDAETIHSVDTRSSEEIEASLKAGESKARAVVLEMVGDLPDADVAPPDHVLFVCKLNPHTTDEDLELIFSRFGEIKCCEIIRDWKTGDSLNYAFIEFSTRAACEEAYLKMNNVAIDDRRIKVDFSQSVAKLWDKYANKPREERKPRKPTTGAPKSNPNLQPVQKPVDSRHGTGKDTYLKKPETTSREYDRRPVEKRRSRSRSPQRRRGDDYRSARDKSRSRSRDRHRRR